MTIQEIMDQAVDRHRSGQLAEAAEMYRQVLGIQPNHADAMHLLGLLEFQNGRKESAVQIINTAIGIRGEAHYYVNLGVILRSMDQPRPATDALRRAVAIRDDIPEAFWQLGKALSDDGQVADAVEAMRRAVALRPQEAQWHHELAIACLDCGFLEEALTGFRRAIALRPGNSASIRLLAGTLLESGLPAESLAEFRRARQADPNDLSAQSNLLYTLHYHDGIDAREIFQSHLDFDRANARPLSGTISPPGNDASPERRLRIGYVSADLRLHSVAFFLLPILEAHDHARFEIVGFPTARARDGITDRFQSACDGWHNLSRSNDDEATRIIRDLGIDILVDLSGHTGNNRLMLFARKPAPIQVSYLGYPNTTGLSTMDYRLTDVHADPTASSDALCSEWLVRLPRTAWCFSPLSGSPAVSPGPVEREGFVTFGSFNPMAKINATQVALWSRIVMQTAGARLLLKNRSLSDTAVRERLSAMAESAGLPRDRLTLLPWDASVKEHLRNYDRLDVALDTYPYHGTTTTCEALFMGVPVVSLAGQRHVSRVGASLLRNVGLGDLVAESAAEYVRIAAELGADRGRLAELRKTLRGRMERSPLMDGPALARDIESAYRTMWRQWCGNHA